VALVRVDSIVAAFCLFSISCLGALATSHAAVEGNQTPDKATRELPAQLNSLIQQRGMPKRSPILLRIFKEESELEVWKQGSSGRFDLLKVYPICRWSGDLGPKVGAGDRQAPEGFYTITPSQMNPNSKYYLAINIGFPNAYDRANDRRGAFLMIHGDCSSSGCYAMTDEQIGEIYSLARESFLGGQPSFQIQAYPFRMTPANMARHRTNPNIGFWTMLKVGNDHFEVSHLEPKIDVCDKRYVFDAMPIEPKSAKFDPAGKCPAHIVNPRIAQAARDKQLADDAQYAQLVKTNAPIAPMYSGLDGGMNRVFLSQVGGALPPARVRPPGSTQQTPDNSGTFTGRLLGLFGWNSSPKIQPASIAMEEESHALAGSTGTLPKPRAFVPSITDASPIAFLKKAPGDGTSLIVQKTALTASTPANPPPPPGSIQPAESNTVNILPAASAPSFNDRWDCLNDRGAGLAFVERWPRSTP
jgi:murein L,D-transpeptidase YafK